MNPKPNPSDIVLLFIQMPYEVLRNIFSKKELTEREQTIKKLKAQTKWYYR